MANFPEKKGEPVGKRYRREIDEAIENLDNSKSIKFSDSDLSSLTVRAGLALLHPMLESNYFIETDDTENLYGLVYDHLLARKSGLYITGEFRVGKTRYIENSIDKLKSDLPIISVNSFSAVRNHRQSKLAFCRDMLSSFRYYSSPHQNPIEALPRYLITNALRAGSKTCALFIDEAQMLTVMQLRYLLEIWNELSQEGFRLVTVLVGQSNLDYLLQLTEQEDHGAVIARFFVNGVNLGGLHSQADLTKYLSAYDDKLFYPVDSEWSYSKYFRSNAFDNGWRMKNESKRFWDILTERTHAEATSLRYNGFRLAFINDAIHSFFTDSMKEDWLSDERSVDLWRQSVLSAATNDLLIGHVSN